VAAELQEALDAIQSIVSALQERDPSSAVILLAPFPQLCANLLIEEEQRLGAAGATAAAETCLSTRYSLAGMMENAGVTGVTAVTAM
jgi:hypothetical protein